MVTGHLGIALGARRFEDTAPLWLMLLAAELPDWADAGVCLASGGGPGAEMWSHSIPAACALAAVLAGAYWLWSRSTRGALLLALLVLSHIAADFLTGVKPTWPGGPRLGVNLYAHPIADALLELLVVAAGWMLYRRTLPDTVRDRWLAALPLVLLISGDALVALRALFGPPFLKC
jgi:hypothetical protein